MKDIVNDKFLKIGDKQKSLGKGQQNTESSKNHNAKYKTVEQTHVWKIKLEANRAGDL